MAHILSGLLVLLMGWNASAQVRVGFLEIYRPDGSLVQLEPRGRFSHLAIEIDGTWLHSHPVRGVEWVSTKNLKKMGKLAVVINLPEVSISPEQVSSFLGKPYDPEFGWGNDKLYCSELIGKLLGLQPRPMYFDPQLWPPEYQKKNGLPGISPDEVYRKIKTDFSVDALPDRSALLRCSHVFS